MRSSVPWRRGIKHRGDEDLPKCLRRRSGGRVGREREGGGVYHFPDFGFPDFGFPDFEMAEYLDLPELSDEEIPPELLEELEREIARNAEANRLAKERELEAKAPKETLSMAAERAWKHEELKSTIDDFKLERKNELKATADTAEKKGNVVDRVNKILNVRERMMAPVLGIIQIRGRFSGGARRRGRPPRRRPPRRRPPRRRPP